MSFGINYILNPQGNLTIWPILFISLILGLLHGATPDEHTWPITFSYSIGSYSSKKGMKAGFVFSLGFTIQRAILTTLGFLGLAEIYKIYNLDGIVYFIVGIVMVLAGAYILNKKKYLHIPFDLILHGKSHHSELAKRKPMHTGVPLKMAIVHGLIAGFGFGAYATIITFILAPQVPSLIYAPLPGIFFGIGTMLMQILFGAAFASLTRLGKISEADAMKMGRRTAGNTLYYGGMAFAVIGIIIAAFPSIENYAISTGNPIPNLDSVNISTFLVLIVVGAIGMGNLVKGFASLMLKGKRKSKSGPS